MFYIYQALDHPAMAWRTALERLRNSGTKAIVFGQTTDLGFIIEGGFDGAYPYDGFAPFKDGVVIDQWYGEIAGRFTRAGKVFVGTVCPGYLDNAAVPDGVNETAEAETRDHGSAATYDTLWRRAIDAEVPIIAVTSFNEWHEGSQIEPVGATPNGVAAGRYRTYLEGPMQYIQRTRYWSDIYKARAKE
jgi:glycoprotein endo-alpha-1,2-mannosidase